MKNLIYRSILATLCAGTVAGCSDFLDTSLDRNETGESIETTVGTLWKFGNAFYTPLTNGYTVLDSNLFAAATDEAQQTKAQCDANYFNQGVINANLNPLSNLYNNYYEGIRAANFFLDYTADGKGEYMVGMNRDTIKDRPSYERDLASLHYYQAEAHIARAYYYTELLKMYGGVPIVESQYAKDQFVARASYDDVVDYIVSEIDQYKDQLAVNWDDYTERNGRFTLGAALAIKSRALLYAASPLNNPGDDPKKWEAAAAAAYELISNGELNYSLDGDYGAYFRDNRSLSSPETIYVVRREKSNDMEKNNYPIATPGGASGVTPTQNLVEAYEWIGEKDPANPYANRDPRLEASIVTNGSTWNGRTIDQSVGASDDMAQPNASRTGYYLKKFLTDNLNLTQGATTQHNWVVFRYAEILLNYAEAMNEAYGPDENNGYTLTAREALQMVRDRASMLLPEVEAETDIEFREAVKRERRIELAFEDHRYWDLLRWKDAMEVLNKPVYGVKVTKTGENRWEYETVEVAKRTFLERNYYMPFSRSEIENSNNTLVQNPGY